MARITGSYFRKEVQTDESRMGPRINVGERFIGNDDGDDDDDDLPPLPYVHEMKYYLDTSRGANSFQIRHGSGAGEVASQRNSTIPSESGMS